MRRSRRSTTRSCRRPSTTCSRLLGETKGDVEKKDELLGELRAALQQKQKELSAAKTEIASLQQDNDDLQNENQDIESRLQALQSQLDDKSMAFDALKEE
eukprot:Sspe_Gene.47853::Locus_24589_Transcript_1_1_Confidence_1.000_Length_810::g.47853::m.47853